MCSNRSGARARARARANAPMRQLITHTALQNHIHITTLYTTPCHTAPRVACLRARAGIGGGRREGSKVACKNSSTSREPKTGLKNMRACLQLPRTKKRWYSRTLPQIKRPRARPSWVRESQLSGPKSNNSCSRTPGVTQGPAQQP